MMVTVNSEACHNRSLAAYAFWISCDQGNLKESGSLPEATGEEHAIFLSLALSLDALYASDFRNVTTIFIEMQQVHLSKKIVRSAKAGSAELRCYWLLQLLKRKYSLVFYEFTPVPKGLNIIRQWCMAMVTRIVKINIDHL